MIRLLAICLTLCPVLAGSALAQDFPTKPVRVIVGAAAGSSGDLLGRLLAAELAQDWKQAVVIDNRPGAGGVIASQGLLGAPVDGSTLMLAAGSYLTVTPFTQKSLPYDVERDFAPIAMAAEVPLMIGVAPSVPATNLKELIAYAAANPGKVNYGANTPGTLPHLATAYFLHSANVEMTYVPYKGAAAAIQDVMGGRLGMVVEGASALAGAVKSGALRPFAVTSAARLPGLDVAAVNETLPGYEAVGFFTFVGQAKLPEAIVRKVNADVNRILARPEVVDKLAQLGNYPRVMSPEQTAQYLAAQRAIWGPVIRRIGFVAQ